MESIGSIERRFLSIAQAADYLGVSSSSLYKYVESERIPFAKFGRKIIFDREDLVAWIKAGGAKE